MSCNWLFPLHFPLKYPPPSKVSFLVWQYAHTYTSNLGPSHERKQVSLIRFVLLKIVTFSPSFSYKCPQLHSLQLHKIPLCIWVPLQWASWLLCTAQQWRSLWAMLTQSPLGVCPPCLSLEHHTEIWKTPPMLKHIIMQYCRGLCFSTTDCIREVWKQWEAKFSERDASFQKL